MLQGKLNKCHPCAGAYNETHATGTQYAGHSSRYLPLLELPAGSSPRLFSPPLLACAGGLGHAHSALLCPRVTCLIPTPGSGCWSAVLAPSLRVPQQLATWCCCPCFGPAASMPAVPSTSKDAGDALRAIARALTVSSARMVVCCGACKSPGAAVSHHIMHKVVLPACYGRMQSRILPTAYGSTHGIGVPRSGPCRASPPPATRSADRTTW